MIPQNAQFNELPKYWQGQILKLRTENRELRARLNHCPIPDSAEIEDLPVSWQSRIKETRFESAKHRHQRNEARAELAALKAQLAK
jgi:hypothetical protein